jgi:plastocyanin
MKKLNGSTSRLVIITTLLFAILVFSDSCTKSSYNNMTGATGGTYGTGGTGGTGGAGNPGLNQIFIQGMAFSPSSITVYTNTTLTWMNKDAFDHTVTSDTGLFDSGNIGANGSFSYTFVNTGTYNYHCKIHGMLASVTVTDPPAPATVPGY